MDDDRDSVDGESTGESGEALLFGAGRRYLLFALAAEELALELSSLEEIVEPGPITRAPGAPRWLLGALNLRGQALPVIDLAGKLGVSAPEAVSERPAILVFHPPGPSGRLGVQVSRVLGFVEVAEGALGAAPRWGMAVAPDLLLGVIGLGDRFVPVLDLAAAVAVAG